MIASCMRYWTFNRRETLAVQGDESFHQADAETLFRRLAGQHGRRQLQMVAGQHDAAARRNGSQQPGSVLWPASSITARLNAVIVRIRR